jgi:transposase
VRDVDLYRQLLGLEDPWRVDHVELSVKDRRVDVYAWHAESLTWPCPQCGADLPVNDHAAERSWRHLDSCGFATYLHARPPRVRCAAHGVHQVELPWAEPHSRFTALFEAFAIDVLEESDVSGACRILAITWDEAWAILERAVKRGMARKAHRMPELIGVDEKSVRKGQDYFTLVSDLSKGTIEHISDERRQASLDAYFACFSAKERTGVRAVAMDMWQPYVDSVRANLKDGDDRIDAPIAVKPKSQKIVDKSLSATLWCRRCRPSSRRWKTTGQNAAERPVGWCRGARRSPTTDGRRPWPSPPLAEVRARPGGRRIVRQGPRAA